MRGCAALWYKTGMSKIIEQWFVFEHFGTEVTLLSKPYKTKRQAEKEREKLPEKERKRIGLGCRATPFGTCVAGLLTRLGRKSKL